MKMQPSRYVATVETDKGMKDMYFTNKNDLINFVMNRTYENYKVTWKTTGGAPKPSIYI